MTDCEKTLSILKDAGRNGVHSFDLGKMVGTWRIAARVNDLKKKGYLITSMSERKNGVIGCRYFLVHETQNTKYKWEFVGNVARQVEDKAQQMSFI